MAHSLPDYEGNCKNLHGHSYKLAVTVMGKSATGNEMVMDFHQLKEMVENAVVQKFDHSLLLNENAYSVSFVEQLKQQFERVVLLPFSPTVENLLTLFVNNLVVALPDFVTLYSVTLQETENSVAEWFADDNVSPVKNIIFDLGGVIYDVRYENIADKLKEYGVTDFEQKYSKAYQTDIIDLYEEGKISNAEFRDYIRSLSSIPLTDKQIDDAWNAILIDIPEDKVELLKKVGKKYNIFMFSNTNQINYEQYIPEMQRKFGYDIFSTVFKTAYFSHILQIKKPKPESLAYIQKEQNLNPAETLFIDDSIQHIKGARKVNLLTHHLTKDENIFQLFSEDGELKLVF